MTDNRTLPLLLHTRDAAKILGVSTAWIERKRWEGKPPRYVRVGGPDGRAVRYREDDLLNYIEENTIKIPASIGCRSTSTQMHPDHWRVSDRE